MRRTLVVTAFIGVAIAATSFVAHSQSQHVFMVTTYRAHPGREADYNQALDEWARPVMDELVTRGVVVSYLFLQQAMGAGEHTHVVIIELPNWGAIETLDGEEGKVARELFGQSFEEWVSVFPPLRERLRSEIYVSP